jgi:molybdate transport system permease protein
LFENSDFTALLTTLKLASLTTLILLVIGTPLAWYLAKMRSKFKVVLEAVVALPLVLPPTVLGFYFLLLFSPQFLPGKIFQSLTGQSLAFTFTGILIGSIVYSLPFVVQPLQKAFEQLGDNLLEAGAMLGCSPLDRFFNIVMPLTRASFITAASLGFAHTIGEFGVVLMIGGNIEGQTRVLSIALFDHVEALEYGKAHWLAGTLLVSSLLFLALVYLANRHHSLDVSLKHHRTD